MKEEMHFTKYPFNTSPPLILTTALCGGYPYAHFTDEESGGYIANSCARGSQPWDGMVRINTRSPTSKVNAFYCYTQLLQ